ncbi:PREDICTED: uncharacterized protein LOC109177271 [Ipomoea nil]|uniref:uncharacterized protein LOC109177271 n=1 Tax=Ipomoea nil TaxID=35883 RepID=UPI000901D36E|nr:PREDICTED: uncharacterized protein LOC109177271 [Ipomoea nil]
MLGSYAQPNNQPLSGWVLVGKDNNGQILKPPTDYTLVWSSDSLPITQSGPAYVWLPVPPQGYSAVGHVVTTSPEKPSGDRIRCVFSAFTDPCEPEDWVWGRGTSNNDPNGFNLYTLRPINRGTQAKGVKVGTFLGSFSGNVGTFACLKNNNVAFSSSAMPNLSQIEALFREYSPILYLHPLDTYHPSSVNWFFSNGALLYTKGDETNPVRIGPDGSNLPQGGRNDGVYWVNLGMSI